MGRYAGVDNVKLVDLLPLINEDLAIEHIYGSTEALQHLNAMNLRNEIMVVEEEDGWQIWRI